MPAPLKTEAEKAAVNVTALLARMDTRTKLMLIDQIADTLDDDLGDELTEGLAVAFERAEEGFGGVFTPLYPYGAVKPGAWQEWRFERDRALAAWFLRFGSN